MSRFEAAIRAEKDKATRAALSGVAERANELKKRIEPMNKLDLTPKAIIKTKTFWAGLAVVLAGIGGVVTGQMDYTQAAQAIGTGLMGIFIRQGMVK